MSTRRQLLKGGVAVGAAAAIGAPKLLRSRRAEAEPATIDPDSIPKFVTPLFILPAMPPTRVASDHDEFQVAQRRISAQVLPSGFPKTMLNGYGVPGLNDTFHSPGYTIETKANRQARVTWMNQLVDSEGHFLPHLLTVDPTIHWANPPGGVKGRDSTPTFNTTPPPYAGPQPMIVHLHGAHDFEESDGLPETWFLPVAKDIPDGFATSGTDYGPFKQEALERWGVNWAPGTLTSVYPNDQRAGTLWYHDHVLGMTRVDVQTGLNGFYIISGGDADMPDGQLPGPRPMPGDPPGKRYYDIVISLSDHSFKADGSLFFPEHSDLTGPYIPDSDIPPYWNSSFQGTVMTANGVAWPIMEVEPRRYRFRFLDADNFRLPILKIVKPENATKRPNAGENAVPFWVIGADGSLLPDPQPIHKLTNPATGFPLGVTMVTSERVDTIVDFTGKHPGDEFILINENVKNAETQIPRDPNAIANVGQIMKFKVIPLQGKDTSLPPEELDLPNRRDLGPYVRTRRLSMNTLRNRNDPQGTQGVQQAKFEMGTIDETGKNHLELWTDPISQHVPVGSTELWEIHNRAGTPGTDGNVDPGGGHAFHIHLVEFQILNRQMLDDITGEATGPMIDPDPWEMGEKDTLFAKPRMVTRFKAKFDLKSRYIYHCHFIDHEDHEMMRPFDVG